MEYSITHRTGAIVSLLLVAMTLFVYWLTLGFGFLAVDDMTYLMGQPRIWDGLTLDNVRWALTTRYFSNWHPLTWISYMVDMDLFGHDHPGGFHLTNVLLHTANVLLLFVLMRQMTGDLWKSAFVAAVFAVHPLRVESVAWVAERKDVLSTFFGFLALIAYVHYVQRSRTRWYWAAWIAFACSLMAKQTLVTLPFVFLLLDYWPLARLKPMAPGDGDEDSLPTSDPARRNDPRPGGTSSWRTASRLVLEKWPFFLLTLAGCIIAVVAQHESGAVVSLEHMSASERLQNVVVVYGLYLVKTIWPGELVLFYPFPPAGVPVREVVFWAIALSAITVGAVWRARRHPYFLIGWLWYLGTLVPVSGLVQIGSQRMADRYMYVPGIGLAIAAAWLIPAIVPAGVWRRMVVPAAAVAVLLALIVAARRQTTYWASSVTLLERTLAVEPTIAVAHWRLGVVLSEQQRFDEAARHFREALRIKPDAFQVHDDLGDVLSWQGKLDEAIDHYEEALRIAPTLPTAHFDLGFALHRQHRIDEADKHFQEALRLDPDNVAMQENIARIMNGPQQSFGAPDELDDPRIRRRAAE